MLLLGRLGTHSGVPSPLLSLSWGPQARLLDRDRLGPKGTVVGPKGCAQFGLPIPVGVSPGPPGARGPAGDVLELAVGFFLPGPAQLLGCPRPGLVGVVHSVLGIPSSVLPPASYPQPGQDDGHLRPDEGRSAPCWPGVRLFQWTPCGFPGVFIQFIFWFPRRPAVFVQFWTSGV
ncbi:hypothetical protein AMECASPLE_039866 [Ameca splendens]|uniref:Uncharacterized protein n=1 Tax=Ameca splendens TaxID=208324 RepID=A0ABV0YJP8_9TELE